MRQPARTRIVCTAAILAASMLASDAAGEELKAAAGDRTMSLEAQSFFSPLIRWTYKGVSAGALYQHDPPTIPMRLAFSRIKTFEISTNGFASDVFIDIQLASATLMGEGSSVRYVADSNDDSEGSHVWHQNGLGSADRMMLLNQVNGGNLSIAGSLSQMTMFDLAETFWESETVEPGELVAVDPGRPDAVRRARGAYENAVIGVASTSPGIVLGRGAFSAEMLRRTWGDEIADEYQRQRPALELELLAERPELLAEAERLASEGAFAAAQAERIAEQSAAVAGSPARAARHDTAGPPPTPAEITAAYESARRDHERRLFDATVDRFFRDNFSAVALAGRVPVKVDASFGPIRPGDPLTSSPVTGVAMRASRPGPIIGTALEALDSGAGRIEVLVHRGWYAGGETSIAGPVPGSEPDAKARRIAELERKLAGLERRLDRLGVDDTVVARAAR